MNEMLSVAIADFTSTVCSSYPLIKLLKTVGFIGAGKMAQALAGGISKDFPDIRFIVSDPMPEAIATFSQAVSGKSTTVGSNLEVCQLSDVVVLAIKPQLAANVLQDFNLGDDSPLVISIMAGVTIASISKLINSRRVIRVMPNTPCLIGEGASGLAAGKAVNSDDLARARSIFASVGTVAEVEEDLIDAVTAVSGSGPAYVLLFVESLIAGGVAEGLPESVAAELSVQTVLGAARLIQETGEQPGVLRERVTSPGGTTLAALKSLESDGYRQTIIAAVAAAAERSRELGKG